MTAVAICGMHRSGTSMTSMLLHKNGVEMGDKKHLEAGATGNPKGFWENHDFVKFNDEVLALYKGNWFNPPLFPVNWQHQIHESLDKKAQDLILSYQRTVWGWKDPRNSLTLPLWKRHLPELKIIVCLRNPLNVVYSYKQTWMNLDRTLALWQSYNERIMLSTTPEERLIVPYDRFFEDPEAEILRMLQWIGIPEDMNRVRMAAEEIDPDLRHGQASYLDLTRMVGSHKPGNIRFHYVVSLYEAMLRETADG